MPIKPFNWECPHCERAVTITEDRFSRSAHLLYIGNAAGYRALVSQFIVCPNDECRQFTLEVSLTDTIVEGGARRALLNSRFHHWRLIPWGAARAFPAYVPQAVRDDYAEACAIKDLSPKAAATLARRAVQGIVRDYWKIVRSTLNAELIELSTRVGTDITQETWDSIDAVRSVGNIGAHMEKEINVIVEVDPDEAELLVQLVETLVDDTYIAREQRQQHAKKLAALKAEKQQQRAGGIASPASTTPGTASKS